MLLGKCLLLPPYKDSFPKVDAFWIYSEILVSAFQRLERIEGQDVLHLFNKQKLTVLLSDLSVTFILRKTYEGGDTPEFG